MTIFGNCHKTETSTEDFVIGENRFSIEVGGATREYIVHIPSGYDPGKPTPVVLMLHGAGGSGDGSFISSGWKELGESENIITVFPTAWQYCYKNINSGQEYNQTLWNSFKNQFEFCENESPRDDIQFLRQILAQLTQKFNIDNHKQYLVGFSSGAQMAFRCAVEMSDVFAAIVESGASQYSDTVYTPLRNLPLSFQLGNSDDTWIDNRPDIPMSLFDSLLTSYFVFQNIISNHTKSFDFDPDYTMSGDVNTSLTATFKGIPDVGNRNFRFILIKGLEHQYPNGVNHPVKGAEQNWEWMKQYTIP